MDIATRIKIFLNDQGIAYSKFADACNISRPTLSQLLTGRNKKVNNEIISKIHRAYPSLSIMWLMFGESPMILNDDDTDASFAHFVEDRSAAHKEEPDNYVHEKDKPTNDKIIFDSDLTSSDDNKADEDLEYTIKNIMRNNYEAMSVRQKEAESKKSKHIVSVMVLYSDNSFESFVPDK